MGKINRIVKAVSTWLSGSENNKTLTHEDDHLHQRTDEHDLVYSFPKSVKAEIKPQLSVDSLVTEERTEPNTIAQEPGALPNDNSAHEKSSQPPAADPDASQERHGLASVKSPSKPVHRLNVLSKPIEGFDFESSIVMLGDESLILKMIAIFLKDSVDTVKILTDQINHEQYSDAQYRIHALIGSAGILGATRLRASAEQLDSALKQRDMIESCFDQFKIIFQSSRASLMSILQSNSHNDASPQAANSQRQAAGLGHKTVLLADDNQFVQHAMQAMLNRHGWHVTIAGNGQEAVSAVKRGRFDIVLMDVQMPVLDGLEATKMIRSVHTNTTLPIIGLSASANPSERTACLACGMTDLIAKTTSPDQLVSLINDYIAASGRS